MDDFRHLLQIPASRLDDINAVLSNPDTRIINDFLAVVAKYGTPEQINQKAAAARQLPALLKKVGETRPEYLSDLRWLEEQRDRGAFISIDNYRSQVLGQSARSMQFKDEFAVTLEISAYQYFPWIVAIANRAIESKMLMPGRFIKVRKMKEQENDGDLPAIAAAMQIIGASYVETLDTKGTDGSNIHLGGPAALFWMMVTAAIGMCTKFVEVAISHKYRDVLPDGSVSGGPMYYMKKRLNITTKSGKIIRTGVIIGGFGLIAFLSLFQP